MEQKYRKRPAHLFPLSWNCMVPSPSISQFAVASSTRQHKRIKNKREIWKIRHISWYSWGRKGYCMEPIKGTVSRDFWLQVFFMNHRPSSQFKFLRKFADKISWHCPFKTIQRRQSRHGQEKTQNYILGLIQYIFPLLSRRSPASSHLLIPWNWLKTTFALSPLSFSMF